MGGSRRIRWGVALVVGLVAGVAAGVGVSAQTIEQPPTTTADGAAFDLQPTDRCPPAEIDRLQRVITFVRSQSWAEDPGSTSFLVNPDTTACRVVLRINEISTTEEEALQRGGEGALSIERTRGNARPTRLPLVLWVVFGGAGLVLVFRRYGRR